MPNVNSAETEHIKLAWTHPYGERRRGGLDGDGFDNTREYIKTYELTADMTENRQYWKMTVKTVLHTVCRFCA